MRHIEFQGKQTFGENMKLMTYYTQCEQAVVQKNNNNAKSC